jgi:hypothetical protein
MFMSAWPSSSAGGQVSPALARQGGGAALDQAAADDASGWPSPDPQSIEDAILHTLLYADLFDYPLTSREIHRYLVGQALPLSVVEALLSCGNPLSHWLGSSPPYWFLADREHLVALHQEREFFSQGLWPTAWRYGHLIAALPFVRLVAVTGSLAMNNVAGPHDDVDYLIVVQRGRVWLTRGLVILVVRLAEQRGAHLCPNYILGEHCLQQDERNLFTAHELVQVVPLYGLDTYHRLLDSNSWIARYLPNALPLRAGGREIGRITRYGQRLSEAVLNSRLGDAVEGWERKRKIRRLRCEAVQWGGTGAIFTADLCKGHLDDHAAAVRQQYASRIASRITRPHPSAHRETVDACP